MIFKQMTKTIGLNMIVKDEAHVIRATLENICSYLPISYWSISDTGSSDGTQDIIKGFFLEKGIDGVLHEDKWKDFGHNRSLALQQIREHCDYSFIFDADDKICGNLVLPSELVKDSYNMILSTCPGFYYKRPTLVSNKKKWVYEGVLHEYITCKDVGGFSNENIEGDYWIFGGTVGNDDAKYARDALVFEKALVDIENEPENIHLKSRYTFYLAQSYRDSRQNDKALEWYQKRADMKDSWIQERYISLYEISKIYLDNNNMAQAYLNALLAWELIPQRLETVYIMISILRSCNGLRMMGKLYKSIDQKAFEENHMDHLFCHVGPYHWQIHYEYSIAAFHCGEYDVAEVFKRIYKYRKEVPKEIIENCVSNLDHYIGKQCNNNDKKKLEVIQRLFKECN